jgi:hypothetical protein
LEWAEDKKKLFRLLGNIGIQKRPNKKTQKCISTKTAKNVYKNGYLELDMDLAYD